MLVSPVVNERFRRLRARPALWMTVLLVLLAIWEMATLAHVHAAAPGDAEWKAEGAEVARNPEEALKLAGGEPVSVIGGAEILGQFLTLADRIELTEVLDDVPGDTLMPDPRSTARWRTVDESEVFTSAEGLPFRFVTLERSA